MGGKTDVKNVQYLETWRPWLSLYGTRIRPVAPVGSISRLPPVQDPSLLHRMLPDELLFEVFLRASPYALGRGACVCRKWRYALLAPALWRGACLKAWQVCGFQQNESIVQHSFQGSWRKMWLERPRLRFDGLYVSRNTYIRSGIAEWKITNPVHLVCYFRYMKFYPSGKCLYKVSPNLLKEVSKVIQNHSSKTDSVFAGRYTLADNQIEAAILYPGRRPTVLRIRLRIRGTTPGANNRLDIVSLVTSGVGEDAKHIQDEDVLDAVEGWEEYESHDPDVPAVSHKRGMASLVFVPFEEVETSVLNLPVEKMDYYLPVSKGAVDVDEEGLAPAECEPVNGSGIPRSSAAIVTIATEDKGSDLRDVEPKSNVVAVEYLDDKLKAFSELGCECHRSWSDWRHLV